MWKRLFRIRRKKQHGEILRTAGSPYFLPIVGSEAYTALLSKVHFLRSVIALRTSIDYPDVGMDKVKSSTTTMGIAARDEHLVALSQVAGRMVHDFNNYLTPIKGYLGLFKEESAPESASMRYVGLMEKAAGKIEFNLSTITEAVRPERSYRPSTANFQDVVRESVAEWTARAASPVPVQTFLSPCVATLDPIQWKGVLIHLLENARLACASGGAVEVRLAPQTISCEKMAELGLKTTNTCLLQVADTGCGMGPDVFDKALEPFFTTRSKDKAIGLGLTQAFNVARLHGGQILLESQAGAGTRVSIWLPL